jgi:dsRNA-specific ribonuclease
VIPKKAVDDEKCQNKLKKLLGELSLPYNTLSLFILAFIHRSIVNERSDFAPEHNERLEFL